MASSVKKFLNIAKRTAKEFAETAGEAFSEVKEELKSQDTKLAEVLKKVDDPECSKEELKESIKKVVQGDKYQGDIDQEVKKLEEKLTPEIEKFIKESRIGSQELFNLNRNVTKLIESKDLAAIKTALRRVRAVNDTLVEANKAIELAGREADEFIKSIPTSIDASPEI